MTIAERLNRMMESRAYNQTDLADRIGTSRQYVNKLCSGKIPNLSTDTLMTIVDAMGGTMSEFFEGK